MTFREVPQSTSFTIRLATIADAAPLATFGARTFIDTFGADNRAEDLDVYLRDAFNVPRQTSELADPAFTTWVAEDSNGELAGYAQTCDGPAPDCVSGVRPLELRRIYVDRRWQGHGLAQRLMSVVLDAVRRQGRRTLWLGVWEKNPRAIAFYARHGFVDVGSHTFWVGTDAQIDRLMMRTVDGPSDTLADQAGRDA